jgi:hypothetical protein
MQTFSSSHAAGVGVLYDHDCVLGIKNLKRANPRQWLKFKPQYH